MCIGERFLHALRLVETRDGTLRLVETRDGTLRLVETRDGLLRLVDSSFRTQANLRLEKP